MNEVSYLHLKSGMSPPVLALPPFKAILVVEEVASDRWREEICAWLVRGGCLYCCAWGKDCKAWHDSVDCANIDEFAGDAIPDERFVMTTWHKGEPLSESMWFLAVCAEHPTVDIAHTLIVHVAPDERRAELLDLHRSAAEDASE